MSAREAAQEKTFAPQRKIKRMNGAVVEHARCPKRRHANKS
jgi:hypothetical protein